jgi:hypothetical protein
MSVASGRLPSVGFVAVCLTAVAVVLFFIWGLSKPPLERIWEIHHLLKIGEMDRLSSIDKTLLERLMAEHGDLARDLLDGDEIGIISAHRAGWIASPTATMLRTSGSAAVKALEIDVQTHDDLLPLTIVVRGKGWKEQREAEERGRLEVPLPPSKGQDEVIEVRIKGDRLVADASVIGVRVTWEARP